MIIDKILSGEYPTWNVLVCFVIVVLTVVTVFFLFKKPLIRGFRSMFEESFATKKDIENMDLKLETELHKIRTNDLFHTNKAILLLAKGLLPESKTDLYKHIKDTILETTSDEKKDEIKSI